MLILVVPVIDLPGYFLPRSVLENVINHIRQEALETNNSVTEGTKLH